jgi:diguanylate cyclase (GGDEF)-like protein/PAS domain S-box-containing protein
VPIISKGIMGDLSLHSDSELRPEEEVPALVAVKQGGRTEELLRLILALSTNFIALPSDEIDEGIHDVLGAVGNFASVDRCYVFQFCENGQMVRNSHEWCARGVSSRATRLQNVSEGELPWLLERIRELGIVHVSDANLLPPKARSENRRLLGEDVRSLVVVPMAYGDSLVGFLGLDSVRRKKRWDEEIISLLKIVGEIFVNALARKKAAETVRISEEKYRNIFENAMEGIFQSSLQGHYLSVNPAMAKMYGHESPEEMMENVSDIGGQLYADPFQQTLIKKLVEEKGHIEGFEVERRRKDGGTFWTSMNARAVRDGNGKTLYYEGTYEDITSRKNMEDLLKKERETFKEILEKAPYGVVLMDDLGTYLYVNPEYTNITGYTLEDVLKDGDWLVKSYPDRECRKDVIKFRRENFSRKYVDRTYSVVCRDCSVKEIEFRKVILDDGRSIITLSDITDKRSAAEALRESEEKFRTLFEDSKDAIYIATKEGRFIDCNNSFLNLFGYTREEAMEVNARTTYFSADDHRNFLKTILDNGAVRDYEVRLLKKNGTVMDCLLTTSERKSGNGTIIGYQGIVRDITSFKKAEETIRHMAYHDALTGLPNRVLFADRLSIAMARARRNNEIVAVAMLDLDGFKKINDLLGHKVGDFILKAVANRLLSALRKSDTVARMGGDEFYVILTEISADRDVELISDKIVAGFRKWFAVDSHKLFVSASIGVAVFPEDGESADILVRRADMAMYAAKRSGKNKYCRYTVDMGE